MHLRHSAQTHRPRSIYSLIDFSTFYICIIVPHFSPLLWNNGSCLLAFLWIHVAHYWLNWTKSYLERWLKFQEHNLDFLWTINHNANWWWFRHVTVTYILHCGKFLWHIKTRDLCNNYIIVLGQAPTRNPGERFVLLSVQMGTVHVNGYRDCYMAQCKRLLWMICLSYKLYNKMLSLSPQFTLTHGDNSAW